MAGIKPGLLEEVPCLAPSLCGTQSGIASAASQADRAKCCKDGRCLPASPCVIRLSVRDCYPFDNASISLSTGLRAGRFLRRPVVSLSKHLDSGLSASGGLGRYRLDPLDCVALQRWMLLLCSSRFWERLQLQQRDDVVKSGFCFFASQKGSIVL